QQGISEIDGIMKHFELNVLAASSNHCLAFGAVIAADFMVLKKKWNLRNLFRKILDFLMISNLKTGIYRYYKQN
ncbi:MAG: hypothetical protein ACXVHV_03865, partial [Methanobacterium sp.]